MFFFGTGRPFTMEDESWSKGIFPPYPSTIYGYLRSTYLENKMTDLLKVRKGGDNDPTNGFTIHKFALTKTQDAETEILYPIPFCFVLDEDKKLEQMALIENDQNNNNPHSHLLSVPTEGKKETLGSDYYFTKEQLEKFLKGEEVAGKPIKITDYLTEEHRIGIAKSLTTNTTQDGKLYRLAFNHLSDNKLNKDGSTQIDFVMRITADNIPKQHIRTLGGEGKKAILQEKEDVAFIEQSEEVSKNYFLYFATPVIIENIEELTKFCSIKTIANNGYEQIGGWDMANKKPKESRSVFPAGTVVFVDFNNTKSLENFIKQYPNNKIGQDTKQGFGEYYIGTYNQELIK